MNRQKQHRGAAAALAVLVLAAVLLFVGGSWLEKRSQKPETRTELPQETAETMEVDGVTYRRRTDLTTILVMGIDHDSEVEAEGSYQGGQADFQRLIVIDSKDKTVRQLKIDRDTMAEVTVLGMLGNPVGTTQMQISLAHGFGDGKEESCGYARDAVSRLLQGENIDFYLAMSLDGISVLNDTDFMSSMPPKLTAATGMDALTHAIEAALSKNANPLTDKDAYWAMQAIVQNLPRAVANGQDEAARTMMAYAENVAGMAFSNAGLGMVHAMAHALGGHYNLPHGVCNAVLLPYVLAFNSRSPVCRERFMTIAAAMGLQGTFTPDTAAPAVIQFVRQLSAGVGIPANLAQLNKVDPADFAALAELALHDTCMSTNQITPTRGEVVAVYTAAFRG